MIARKSITKSEAKTNRNRGSRVAVAASVTISSAQFALISPGISRSGHLTKDQHSERSNDAYGVAKTRQTVPHPGSLANHQIPGTRGNRDTRAYAACHITKSNQMSPAGEGSAPAGLFRDLPCPTGPYGRALPHWFTVQSERLLAGMKTPKADGREQLKSALSQRTPIVPRVSGRIRQLVNSACAARGGAGRMTLNDWLKAEQELKHELGKKTNYTSNHKDDL